MLRPLAAITAFMLFPAAALAQDPVIRDQQQDTLQLQQDTVQMQQDTLRQQQYEQEQQIRQEQQRQQQQEIQQQQVEEFEGRLDVEFRGPAQVGEPHFGLSRERVRELQMALNEMGCDAGPVDGLVGPLTARGMACAQEQLGIRSQDPNALFHALNLSFMREHREHNEQVLQQQRAQPEQMQPQPQPEPRPDEPRQPPQQDPQPTPPQPQPPR